MTNYSQRKAQVHANKSIDKVVGKCPQATQDVDENTKNRNRTIDNYGYGPMNPDMPSIKFWEEKADIFNTSVEEAQSTRCGNCAAFDQSKRMLNCIIKGINEKNSVADPKKVVIYGNLGYCQLFKFKCAGDRTCDAWVHGGPITS